MLWSLVERGLYVSICINVSISSGQVSLRYSEATRLLSNQPLSDYLPAIWLELARTKRIYFEALARYYIATALLTVPVDSQPKPTDRTPSPPRSPRDPVTLSLINAHSRVIDKLARHAVYSDSLVETSAGRTLLGSFS